MLVAVVQGSGQILLVRVETGVVVQEVELQMAQLALLIPAAVVAAQILV
jgi:hypothetical protein